MNLLDETIQRRLVQLTEFPLKERCIAAAIEGEYNNFTCNDGHSILVSTGLRGRFRS